ncbi:related to Polyketide synthase [Melanopsichium pennsylvanicum]|uniref:Related to Polyketide synthase n=2 Tax=Melanopsichium pennsylvanicum TaxID=63383 RepID=A0AAJ5C8L3_9BASI|nr:related to Polyketide synthase [Melanopsichium pennsylvanicum 4]SNX88096.1 related to Polyketide synthase [Melanopsichium pennsylvanicum]
MSSGLSSFDNINPRDDDNEAGISVPDSPHRAPFIIFGSQGCDFLAGFDPILALSRHFVQLAAFLSFALDAIRAELQSVANRHGDGPQGLANSKQHRESDVELLIVLPPFEPFCSLSTLVDFHRRNNLKDPVINGVLLCLLQTASVVAIYCASLQNEGEENEYHDKARADHMDFLKEAWKAISRPYSHLLGFCTGALSAFSLRQLSEESATPSSCDIWAYAQDAIKAMRICFWVSLRSAQARMRLAETNGRSPHPSSDHWSLVVAVKDPDHIEKIYLSLSEFDELERRRPLDEPVSLVVTARAVGQVSIGGPPLQLQRFKEHLLAHFDSKCRTFPLEIFSPYHSPDLEIEMVMVMQDLQRRGLVQDMALPPSQKILWETANANILAENSLRGALHVLVHSNLCSTADWDAMVDRVVLHEGELPGAASLNNAVIVSFGPGTNLAVDLSKRLARERDSQTPQRAFIIDVPSLLREVLSSAALSLRRTPLPPHPQVDGEEVVIVSMACRFPGDVHSPEQLWTCLETGRSTVREIPKHLFDIDAYYGEGMNQTLARHMHAMPENVVKSMDARLFSMSPKEIEQLDPQHRLVMLCSYEALERAGYSPEANSPSSFDAKRIAVCMGASWDDYRENAGWNIGSYFITGNIRAFIPGHVSFSLNWEGPSVSVDSLECSAVSAIQWSRRALLSGQCDVALAGAVNVLTQPQMFIAMDKEGVLSRSGTNATFSAKLDGKTRGEGCGVLLLKRRSTAIRDGDRILATLPAARITYHGQPVDGEDIPAQQSRFLAQVLSEANISQPNLVHIEASGSHTQQREADEFDSFARLLAEPKTNSAALAEDRVSVASIRPNIGDCEAVSAMASIMKAVLMIGKGSIPRQVSISQISDLQPRIAATCASSALFVPTHPQLLPPSRDSEHRRFILVNSLASTGCHGAVLVGAPTTDDETLCEELPVEDSVLTGSAWIFTLSAKTRESGGSLKKALIDYLQREVCLADLSYTLACRRTHHPFRLCVVASDQDELIRRLLGTDYIEAKPSSDLPNFGLFFQTPGAMFNRHAKVLFDMTPVLQQHYEELTSTHRQSGLAEQGFRQIDVMQICLSSFLDDCAVRPAIVAGNHLPSLFSGCLSDKQAIIRALCQLGSSEQLRALEHVVQKDAAKLLTEHEVLSPTPFEHLPAYEPAHSVPAKGTLGEAKGRVPLEYCWITIGDTVDLASGDANDEISYATSISEAQKLQRSLLSSLGQLHQQGYAVRWIEYFRPLLPHLKLISDLSTYPFHLQQFWMEYHDRNLLQHASLDRASSGTNKSHAGVSAVESGQAHTYEPLTEPLLTAQCGADDRSRTYTSDITDEAQLALLRASTPSAMVIELMIEAIREATDSFNTGKQMKHRPLPLRLVRSQLLDAGRGLLDAQDARICVIYPSTSLDGAGEVTMSSGAVSPLIARCHYRWNSDGILGCGRLKWQGLLQARIRSIQEEGELLAGKLIRKGLHAGSAMVTESIRCAFLSTQWREVIFCNQIPALDVSNDVGAQCVLPLLISTLEQCACWYNSQFGAHMDAEYGIVAMEGLYIGEEWLQQVQQFCDPARTYMAFVSCVENDKQDKLPEGEFRVNITLLDNNLNVLGELEGLSLAKAVAPTKKPAPSAPNAAAPEVVSGVAPAANAGTSKSHTEFKPHILAASTTKQNTARTTQTSRAAQLHTKVMEVLAAELGIAIDEMRPGVKFADLGLDSLMSLVCISTLETLYLGFEIPQSLFMECDSPEELLAWIRDQVNDSAGDDDNDVELEFVPTSHIAMDGETIPTDGLSDGTLSQRTEPTRAIHDEHSSTSCSAVDYVMVTIASTIERELGVENGSIDANANLADLGMDSLMSLLVLSSLSGTLPVELPASLFMDCNSLGGIRALLATQLDDTAADAEKAAVNQKVTESAQNISPAFTIPPAKKPTLIRPGTNSSCKTPLFLLPDGSGMSTVYAGLHAIDCDIYSINSPFLSDASAWVGGMVQITQYYLSCMKLIQNVGPWLVGGWSFGGMAAFQIAISLTESDNKQERIAALFLLDSPSPALYSPLPMGIVDWIFTAPEVKDIAPPALSRKLIAHFKATVDSLVDWHPSSFQPSNEKIPKVYYIVADDPLPGKIQDVREVNDTVRWLFRSGRAEVSGSDGWEKFIPKQKIQVVSVKEANHFTIIRDPALGQVAQVLQDGCRSALQN